MAMKRGSGPGTQMARGVSSAMDAPFGKGVSTTGVGGGIYGKNKGPFDAPQSMGGGSIPTKFFDGLAAKPAATVNSGMVSPPIGSTQAVGQRRFKSGK